MSTAEVMQLPIREKFQILEALWEDLSAKIDDMPLSEREQALLDSRLERIESGESKIHDWDTVKHSIGKND